MSKRSKACDITMATKNKVWERDNQRCILCGTHQAMPNAHYIPRSKGGLGIEQNIVTLCLDCHIAYDQTKNRKHYQTLIKAYLNAKYQNWNEEELKYTKW